MKINHANFEYLSDRELLGLMLREKPDSPAIPELVVTLNNRSELMNMSLGELASIKGVGSKRAAQLLAALELGKRFYTAPPVFRAQISSPDDIADILIAEMRYLDREHFRCVYLNRKNHILSIETISIGGLSHSLVHPREVFKPAIKRSAASVILCHNHPSGNADPSTEDIEITKRLLESGRLLGIEILDHIIVGDGCYTSLKARNLI